jgi:uncharacterized repeat protein (TIGR04138 family)
VTQIGVAVGRSCSRAVAVYPKWVRGTRAFFMQKIGFAEALDSIVTSDPRYARDAYVFLRDALDFTTKQQKKIKGTTVRHVAGPELLEGVRQYALKEFGPMVISVFSFWGIKCCEDVGHMVFNLIEAGIFGKTDEDSIEDFKSVYDFEDAFVRPFAPPTALPAKFPAGLPEPNRAASNNSKA